jgi:hypothetical protein
MRADGKRESGFYWVRFEGQIIVAEYTADGLGCSPGEGPHWHVPLSDDCFSNQQVCELLSARLDPPGCVRRAETPVRREAEAVSAGSVR